MLVYRLIFVFVFIFVSFQSHSHTGVTSAEGCHSNEDTSGYHCHNNNIKRNRYPYTISRKIKTALNFEKKDKGLIRQLASVKNRLVQKDKLSSKQKPSLKHKKNSQGRRLAFEKSRSKKNLSLKGFQPRKKNKTRGLASIENHSIQKASFKKKKLFSEKSQLKNDRNRKKEFIKDHSKKVKSSLGSKMDKVSSASAQNKQQLSLKSLKNRIFYELLEEKIDDIPLKTQIIQHLVVHGVPSKDHLKVELLKRYRLLRARQGFKQRKSPTNIYIYVYDTKKQAKSRSVWMAMLGWSVTDAVQTKDPSVQFNESLLSKLSKDVKRNNKLPSKVGGEDKSTLVQDQKSSTGKSQSKFKEALVDSPVKALKGVPQIRKKMKLKNVKSIQFKEKKRFSNKEKTLVQSSKKVPKVQSTKQLQPKVERSGASFSKSLNQARKVVSRVQNSAKERIKALSDKSSEKKI